MSPAEIIAHQLGSGTIFMLGARGTLTSIREGRGLAMRIKGSPNRINVIRIELAADDTYTLEFAWVRAGTCTERAHCEGIYADKMHAVIRAQTGLEVHMPRVIMGGAR